MRFADYPFLKYLPILIAGILLARRFPIFEIGFVGVLLAFGWISYFLILQKRKSPRNTFLLSGIAYGLIFLLGIFLVRLKESQLSDENTFLGVNEYLGEVTQYDTEKSNSFENLLQVKSVLKGGSWQEVDTKVLVYHQNQVPLLPGQLLWVKKSPEPIPPPINPHEFDYRFFLARKGIFYRQFLSSNYVALDSSSSKFDYLLSHVRFGIASLLRDKIPDKESEQIALALLLGQKQNLDPAIREGYTQVGVMHILAVSGLHVGIIYALFLMLVKPLKLPKKWLHVYFLAVIFLIWVYAFLTGLSPSVVRAATMFSLLSLGQMRERKPSIFNILAFSAILMIVIDPEVIFEVGFQLSYLAVAGIVLIQPLILNWWLPPNRFWEYVWQLISVSLAAQLATFPLSIFYFHQFPTYFLLGNLIVIPISFLIMQVGVPLMIFGWIPYLGEALGWILSKLIYLQNFIIHLIKMIPGGKLEHLTITLSTMILIWVLLLIWASWLHSKRKNLVYFVFILVFFWSAIQLFDEIKVPARQMIVYSAKEGFALDFSFDGKLYSWNQSIQVEDLGYHVNPNRISQGWDQTPDYLYRIPDEPGFYRLYPSPVYLNKSESGLFFGEEKPSKIEIWRDQKWQMIEYSDSLKLGNAAFRIVF